MGLMQLLGDPLHQAHILACSNQPASAAARLAYAAALEAAGDPRGELLRLEVALQGPRPPGDATAERARLAALLDGVEPTWWELVRLSHPIRHCGSARAEPAHIRFAFKCPMLWSLLEPTDQAEVRHCGQCDEHVYLSRTRDEVEAHARAGRCVAVERQLDHRVTAQLTEHFLGRPDGAALWARDVFREE